MNLTFAANLTKMIDAGLGREAAPPETFVAVGRTTEYTDLGPVPIASFETNVESPLRALSVSMEPVQAGTGDPSPENVRPITGRSAVTVTRSGVNVWDEEWDLGDIDGVTGLYKNGNYIRSKHLFPAKPSTSYYIVIPFGIILYEYDINKDVIRTGQYAYHSIPVPRVYVVSDKTYYLAFRAAVGGTYANNISFNYPSTDHDYHPGHVQTVEISLGETVYGGSLDVVAGKLYSEWANIASYDGEELPGEWISSMDVYSEGATPTTGAQVCYKLAEPVEITLIPEQITTLIGANNVWSDGGDVSLTYGTVKYTEGY